MIKEISLYDEINKGGFQTSLITTFNAYFPFYEEVILRKLVSKSIHHNLVLMDKNQFSQSIKSAPPKLAGTHYSIFPMNSPGAFHPKILLLAGKKKGILIIGSHNLTISGFGYNRELTNVIRYSEKEQDEKALNLIRSAWIHINTWLQYQLFPPGIVNMVNKMEALAPWLKGDVLDEEDDVFIISSQADQQSICSRLLDKIGHKARRVIVTGAFFDSELAFVRAIQEQLNPTEIIVAVDPTTVSLPNYQTNIKNVRFVNSSQFGTKKEGDENTYLHAKSMFIEDNNGTFVLITGSANPSKPAWLIDGLAGNTETVLCRRDDLTNEDAEKIGFFKVLEMPPLEINDWEKIEENWSKIGVKEKNNSSDKAGIALSSYNGISLNIDIEESIEEIQCMLLDPEKKAVKEAMAVKSDNAFIIKLDKQTSKKVSWIQCEYKDALFLYLVHHESEIAERAKTGIQRKLKDALSSIGTDSPDIGVVIDCVSRIIFSNTDGGHKTPKLATSKEIRTDKKKDDSAQEGAPLSGSIKDDPKYKRKKSCINKSEDLSWLFDTLLYHLNLDLIKKEEKNDDLDDEPNEEELVGSDDDVGEEKEKKAITILNQCHNKIRTLVRRMLKQFDALRQDKAELGDVILKLTGTLALLRHLRECDGKIFWIPKGNTSFPLELRKELLDGIIHIFFDGRFSLTFENEANSQVYDTDELARLKGLIAWLAWDAGIKLDTEKGFNESFGERERRLRENAIMIHLAQLVGGDEIVKFELSKSMIMVAKKESSWLNWLNYADGRIRKVLASIDKIDNSGGFNKPLSVGALAINKKNLNFGVRIIGKSDKTGVEVFSFLSDKKFQRLTSTSAVFIKFNSLIKHQNTQETVNKNRITSNQWEKMKHKKPRKKMRGKKRYKTGVLGYDNTIY